MRSQGNAEGVPSADGPADASIPARLGKGLEVAGRCRHCLARCVGRPADHRRIMQVFNAHEACCPGGNRSDVVWVPFAAGATDQSWSIH